MVSDSDSRCCACTCCLSSCKAFQPSVCSFASGSVCMSCRSRFLLAALSCCCCCRLPRKGVTTLMPFGVGGMCASLLTVAVRWLSWFALCCCSCCGLVTDLSSFSFLTLTLPWLGSTLLALRGTSFGLGDLSVFKPRDEPDAAACGWSGGSLFC